MTVEDCWNGYRASLGERPAATTMGFEWKSIGPAFGSRLADAITEDECNAYTKARRAKGRSDGTIWTELGRLRMCLVWAEGQNLIGKAPLIKRPAPPKPRDKHLSRAQASALIDACNAPHVRLFAILAITTAGRAGAILDLTWDRVDFERGLIHLDDPERATTNKGRATVPMNNLSRTALAEARESATSSYVIEWAGEKVGSVKKGIKAAGRKIGCPWVSPHVFRHSAARFMAEAGRPMTEIAAFLGHSDSRLTERVYAKFSPTYLRETGSAVDLEVGPVKRRA
ncbi:tyrosine-type recombinase/integrase [Alsobacter metallidurans]|uniref:tyrosine-type recombinase/integrase n=1 Tax=Alsobacter metallidurans TaxID=340221 RepID=UPI001667DD4D|nr:site-specific integrase [Alsobacter metallidurans]